MDGNELKQIRENLGLSQAEFADKVGVERNTVWRWENDKLPISKTVELAVKYLQNEAEKQCS